MTYNKRGKLSNFEKLQITTSVLLYDLGICWMSVCGCKHTFTYTLIGNFYAISLCPTFTRFLRYCVVKCLPATKTYLDRIHSLRNS